MSLRKKYLKFYYNTGSVGIVVITICYLLVGLYGIDAGSSFIGGIRLLGVLFFMFCAMQMSLSQKNAVLEQTAIAGSIMVMIGIAAVFIPPAKSFFYTARRLGGFFQYANVFALFCLLGIIVIGEGELQIIKRPFEIIHMVNLMLGIFLSGSRTVLLLLLPICIIQGIRNKKMGKYYLILMSGMLSVAIVYAVVSGDFQNVGRFLTVSFTSSTFLGRILYIKDGLRILRSHPFGLGYMGYYFLESMCQTGVYTIRYVHNDILQLALDIGIFPAVLLIVILIRNIFGKGSTGKTRLMVSAISVHCLMDFDLEFISIWMLLVLTLDIYKGREINISAGGYRAFYKWLAGFVSVGSVYMGVAMLPYYICGAGLSVKLLPFYTEARVRYLEELTDPEEAWELAEDILSQNEYIPTAYDVLSAVSYSRGEFLPMAEYKRQSVLLQKYNIEVYERYLLLLGHAITQADSQGDLDTVEKL